MNKLNFLADTLDKLREHYDSLSLLLPLPAFDNINSQSFRHPIKTIELFCLLKGIKLISTLNAALVLQREGYVQEIASLCRMADDLYYEVLFVINSQQNSLDANQKEMISEFYKEEFTKPDEPLRSHQSRSSVSRRIINASFGKSAGLWIQTNPYEAQLSAEINHKTLSGYVHGAYPQIMELYGGQLPKYHMSGMLNTPRINTSECLLVTYVYRAIMATFLIAYKLNATNVKEKAWRLIEHYEQQLNIRTLELTIKPEFKN